MLRFSKPVVKKKPKPVSQQRLDTLHAAREAEQERQRQLKAQRAAARVQLRNAPQLRNSLVNDEEEDVWWDCGDFEDAVAAAGSSQAVASQLGKPQQPSSSRPLSSGQHSRSHTDNMRRQEATWREQDQRDIAIAEAYAGDLSSFRQEDRQVLVNLVQQRIDAYTSNPLHPCEGGGGVVLKGRRQILLQTLMGFGVIEVPQFHCSTCGYFEMSPAAVGCGSSGPSPTTWLDYWLCTWAAQLGARGLATATFCTCADAVAAGAEQLSAEPVVLLSASEKTLSAAVRHHVYVQRQYTNPARHGADIWRGPMGHCPPCGGAVLAGEAATQAATVAREGLACSQPAHQLQPAGAEGRGEGSLQVMAAAMAGQGNSHPPQHQPEAVAGMAGQGGPHAAVRQPAVFTAVAGQGGPHPAQEQPVLSEAGALQCGPQPMQQHHPAGEGPGDPQPMQQQPTRASGEGLGVPQPRPQELQLMEAATCEGPSNAGVAAVGRQCCFKKAPHLLFIPGRQAIPAAQPRRQRPISINFDANAKLGHYKNCGRATTAAFAQLPPLYNTYFGSGERVAQKFLEKLPAARAEPAGDPAAGEGPSGCDAHLSCARPVASKSGGVTDIKCTVGTCCAPHGVPLKDGFLSGETPEQFAYYVALLFVLRGLIPPLAAVLLDINCQYSKHLQSKFPQLCTSLMGQAAIVFYIGWLHARAGHNIDCQLKFSALFQEGMGRCVGELIEQLWAFMKPVARRTRYMSLPHRVEVLELSLDVFATSKYTRMHELLVQSAAHAVRRKEQLEDERAAVVAQGRELGFVLDASQAYVMTTQELLKMDPGMKYVKNLSKIRLMDGLSAAGGAALVGLEEPAARALAAQNSEESRQAVKAEVQRLRAELGIVGVDWTEESTEYQEAGARLRQAELQAVQVRVERHVSHLSTLQEDRRAELQSGHNSGLVRNKIRYRVKQIQLLMSEWDRWYTFLQPPHVQPPKWEEADVFSNKLPWTDASAAQGLTEDHLRFKLHCIQQELLRTEEELLFLPQDALNSLAYFQHQQELLDAACKQCEVQLGETASLWSRRRLHGQLHILASWQQHVGSIYWAAWAAFVKAGWVEKIS